MLRKKLKLDEEQNEDIGTKDIEFSEANIGQTVSITFEMMYWEKIWKLEQQLCKFLSLKSKVFKKRSSKNLTSVIVLTRFH
jgi:hypothetical protein